MAQNTKRESAWRQKMMTDGNRDTAAKADEESNKITTSKIPHVVTADGALKKIPDIGTPIDEQAKEIPDPVKTTDEQVKEIQNPATPTDDQVEGIQDQFRGTQEQVKEIPDPATIAHEQSKEVPFTFASDIGSQESEIEEEFVHVPKGLKRFVIGMGGIVVRTIEIISGASVVTMPGDVEGFTVIGNKEQRACARQLILEKVELGVTRQKENELIEVSYCIDELNLPAGCKLKLEQVAPEDSIALPEAFTQYRIKPVKGEEFNSADDDPSYMSKLTDDTLESIRKMKSQMETMRHLKVEMCCCLGMVIVCRRMEGDENMDAEWTVDEATNKLRGSQWRTTFKAGVDLNEKVLQEHAFDKTPKDHEDYSSRYDLTFLISDGQQINIWVWVTKKNLGKSLKDILIPPGHTQNALEEIHFKDETTRSRCRGWLVLRPQRYLRTDILFPGCEFDCRLTITGNSERASVDTVPEEDRRRDLARYVSAELTFVETDSEDDFEIRLPEQNLPDGFQLSKIRCSKRALYGFMPGFKIVLSKEISRDIKTRSRVSSAFYLPCDEKEDTGEWQPEALVKKLPDFFRFIRKVQSLFGCQMEEVGLVQKDKSEFVHVPKDLICYVIGRNGRVIKEIRKISGARVFLQQRDTQRFTVIGNEEQRATAKSLILEKAAGGRIKCDEKERMKLCYYIDEWNLPADCKLKLVVQEDSERQEAYKYRLKPAEVYGPQRADSSCGDPSYLAKLSDDVLKTLRKIKDEIKTKTNLKADIWCHCGKVVIQRPKEGTESRWDVEEAVQKLQPPTVGDQWRTRFNGGIKVDEKLIEEHIVDKTPEEYDDYSSRYDFQFETPSGQELRLKVWVTKRNSEKEAKDIPTPSTDVTNILRELQFKDKVTRSRCRGWLTLTPRQYLRADILFPGCEFDCRLTIRGRTDSAFETEHPPKEETTSILSEYLSELTFSEEDDFGLRFPKRDMPSGFRLSYKRCSKRAQYGLTPEFSIILSKESSYRNDVTTETKQTDFHLRCKEWDDLLNSSNWEPEAIVERLPEFFRFVKKVQSCFGHEMKESDLPRTVPPEILARGRSALEAYGKALADGKASVRMVPIMLIGQDRAGKTSLKKSLKGKCFDPKENSTVGIDVDPSYFQVTTETWRTGTTDDDSDSSEVTSFEFQTAKRMAGSLKEDTKNTVTDYNIDESPRNHDSKHTETSLAPISTEPSEDEKRRHIPSGPATTHSKDAPHRSPDPMHVPEEVATVAETLLQSEVVDDREDIFSTLWDFAGQTVYYETHPLFLTKRAIYFLVYNLSLDPYYKAAPLVKQGLHERFVDSFNLKTNMDYLDFWMMSVACLANSQKGLRNEGNYSEILPEELPPVFLVCTHADKPYKEGNPKDLSRQIFGSLKNDKPYGSHLVDFYVVDNTLLSVTRDECPEVQRLRKDVRAVAERLPYLNEAIPIKWLKFEKALRALTEEGNKWIAFSKAKGIASSECSITEDKELETLMNYLHDLRSLIHFDDTRELNELVVLDSQWLIDIFKKVITIKPYEDRRDAKFEKLWLKLERKGILDKELLDHLWGTLYNSKETYQSLIGIMEKFNLVCSWPSDASETQRFLVPSMLRTPPPENVKELVASSKTPSLFVTFDTDQVPPGLFPRLMLQFSRWAKENMPSSIEPQLFHGFARFFTSDDDGSSVILRCHLTFLEIVVYRVSVSLVEDPSLKMISATHFQHNTAGFQGVVRRQLSLMLKRMGEEFFWLRDVTFEMSVLCPVCCDKGSVKHCPKHHKQSCDRERCLHFHKLCDLEAAKKPVICESPGFTADPRVNARRFSAWFEPSDHQELHLTHPIATSQGTATQGISDQRLKVTLLASEWGSSMGGLSTLNKKLAMFLAKHNQVNVTVLVPQDVCGQAHKRNAEEHNVTIREAQKRPGYDPLDWLGFPPEDLAIDVVLGHGVKLGKQVQVIRKTHPCNWIQVVHTAPEELGMYKDYFRAIAKGQKKNEDEVDLCKLANLVVAVGPKLTEAYSSYLRSCKKQEDIFQLTPGVFQEFSTVEQVTQERKNFKVLIFGRGDLEDFELKGYDTAAKAVELLGSSYRLVFVGASEGKEEEVAEKFIQSGVSEYQLIVRTFVKSEKKMKELFCEVDLAIMPSRTDGFGLTALEALSAGLPILVSSNSGFGEALRELPTGKSHLVESHDPKIWANAIASVRQKDRAQRLLEVQALREDYEKKYSWEDQCGDLVKKMLGMVHAGRSK